MEEPRSKKMNYFEDDKFWFTRKGAVITVGVSVECFDDIGTVESVTLPNRGDDVDKEDSLVDLKGSDGYISVYTPAGGVIIDINSELEEDPSPVNDDPDGEGWLFKIQIQDTADLKEYE